MSTPETKPDPNAQPKSISVSHVSAAISQLDTAIQLWFTEGDPISIHTLAWSSLQLLHDQGSKPGVDKPSNLMLNILKLPKKQRARAGMVTAIGKHADRRYAHNAVEYPPELTEDIIFEALTCCWKLFDDLSPWMRVFATRYMATNPKLFEHIGTPALVERLGGHEKLARLSRRDFAKEVIPVLSREDFWFSPAEKPGQA